MQALSKFVAEVRSVDPRATGNPLQAYEASIDMKRSYEHAAIYAGSSICRCCTSASAAFATRCAMLPWDWECCNVSA